MVVPRNPTSDGDVTTDAESGPEDSEMEIDPADKIRIIEVDNTLGPDFDLGHIHSRLRSDEGTIRDKQRLIVGLHIKFWHAPAPEMQRMLHVAGHTKPL